MKILVSWVAMMHDFQREISDRGNKINYDGPTFNFHKDFFKHEKHIVLVNTKDELDPKISLLLSELRKEHPGRNIEPRYIDILDVIDMAEIRSKVEGLLLRDFKNEEIDIFFSPGTSAMQIAWYLIHESQILNTNLFQVRPKGYSKSGKAELLDIKVSKSNTPSSSIIKEEQAGKHIENYKITKSLEPIYKRASLIANADAVTTLIYGDSGTGKEHLARYIHEESARSGREFIAINCSAFTDELLESRLLGHKKGTFTGAIDNHMGFFESAKGGTVFLDEIGDISPYMQQLLLRVIQEKKILPIGENKERKIDVRIIAATNKDLTKLCGEDKFRWDLYYRLAVTELNLPPLIERENSERKELLDYFLMKKKELFKRSKKLSVSKGALQVILNYPFPGNVRELENLVESLYVFNEVEVNKTDLPERILSPADESKMDLNSIEKAHVEKVLKMVKSNAEACRILGITINTLKAKMKLYELV
ncbi:RNA repair transcriptional activator RtcR family protein [Pedobacter namyangjuensis]|uniref:RNA repair transcriptional activator RtcR family protein n=1 Tax=Pedobacter namyangjuensis TaxID=600626 RepID=UPI000DE4D0F8|nr:RNA repair transcriptional activator RtcR family protein [Pedobacter namyangjuensis]